MTNQLFWRSGIDIDIVQLADTDVVQQVMEDVLYEAAENGRRVGKTKRHPRPLK